ncbi:protein DWARF AND LOW-TILLERING-like [Wolffia australiana]
MLAGCSSTLLSLRHQPSSEATVSVQARHSHVEEDLISLEKKMSSQRLDLPRGFSRRGATARVAAIDKQAASFPRPNSPSSSSLVARSGLKRRLHGWPYIRDMREGVVKRRKLKTHQGFKSSSFFSPAIGDFDEASSSSVPSVASKGVELVDLLAAGAEAVGRRNYEAAVFFLGRLGRLSSPRGSAVQRAAACFAEALALRASKLWPGAFSNSPRLQTDDAPALRALNSATPALKFIHYSLNERLLRALNGKQRIHIIDFDVKQGLQWAGLLQSLASRPWPLARLRITGVGNSKKELRETGARLASLAAAMDLSFEFHAVVERPEDLRLWMLHVKEEEAVAVNCVLQLHRLLCEERGLAGFLRLVKSVKPEIVLVAEQEARCNSPRWEARFAASLLRYSAVFDMVEASLPRESLARAELEGMFFREVRNVVSEEGEERVERYELFDEWRRKLEESGYRCAGVGEEELRVSRMLLRMFGGQSGFGLEVQGKEKEDEEENGAGLTLTWRDQPLYTVSAWEVVQQQ